MNNEFTDSVFEEMTPQLINKLAETPFCESGISELAEMFRDIPVDTANSWVEHLTEAGEDQALTRLLETFSYLGFVLDPAVLVRSGFVTSDISSIPFPFMYQDENVIPHLLKAARAEELSYQRQILYARLAAELTLRDGLDDEAVRRLLHYLSDLPVDPRISLMAIEALAMLEAGRLEKGAYPVFIECDIKKVLPERAPPKVISTGGTIRRPVAKVGRNDPCHCGSGKKYKRCCLSEDEKLLEDASEYEGITRSQLLENPGAVRDTQFIEQMRAYEIKKLDPKTLNARQLLAAYERAKVFGLLDLAFEMFVECFNRTDHDLELDPGHFVELMEQALNAGNMDVAARARKFIPADFDLVDWDDVNMQFDLYQNPGVLASLEKRCATALDPDAEYDFLHDHDLLNLSHILRRKFPALSILFARAAVSQCPNRVLDNELLVDVVHECRVDLGLDPWDDPIDEMVSEGEQEYKKNRLELKNAGIESGLRGELAEARDQAKLAAKKLRDAEENLRQMKKELAEAERDREKMTEVPVVQHDGPSPEQQAIMDRLRRQIENLKVEVGNQQEQRRKLREQLENEQRIAQRKSVAVREEYCSEEDDVAEMPSKKERRVIIPEYRQSFRDACRNLPASIVESALKSIGGIAAYDGDAWRNFRSIKRLSGIYRLRVGIHHRLLLKWIPGKELSALDLIPRQELESWIKRHSS